MTVRFSKPFLRQYAKLPKPIQEKVDANVCHLAQNLRHPGIKARKMQGHGDVWEGRVDQSYRFTFQIVGDVLLFRRVGTHAIYKRP